MKPRQPANHFVIVIALGVAAAAAAWGLRRSGGSTAPPVSEHRATRPDELLVTLPESFERQRSAPTPWGGGSASPQHATDGAHSYHVAFSHVSARGFYCRPGSLATPLPADRRLEVDVFNPGAPFSVRFIFAGADGRELFRSDAHSVAPGPSTLECALEAWRESPAPRSLAEVKTLQIAYAGAALERGVEAYFDALRLSGEMPEPPAAVPGPASMALPGGALPDGQLERGFAAWRLRRYPASNWTFSIVTGDGAFEGGPSLGMHALDKGGGAALVSLDLVLEPGLYLLRKAVRGSGEVSHRSYFEEWRDGVWVGINAAGRPLAPAPETWKLVEEELTLGGDPELPRTVRTVRLVLEAGGLGDVFLDALSLTPDGGRAPPHPPFDLDLAAAPAGDPPARSERWRWNGAALERSGDPSFPIFYREEDVPPSDGARRFRERCRRLGLEAALHLGPALHGGGASLAAGRAFRHAPDAGIAVWLATANALWEPAGIAPGRLRGFARALGERDGRLVLTGLPLGAGREASQRYASEADGVVLGEPLAGAPSAAAYERWETSLTAAARATGGRQPILVELDARASAAVLLPLLHLARIHGAHGAILSRFDRMAPDDRLDADPSWPELESVLSAAAGLEASISGARFSEAAGSDGPVRFRIGKDARGGRVAVLVNLSSERRRARIPGAAPDSPALELSPWEGKALRLE